LTVVSEKQQELAARARELHGQWVRAIGDGRVTNDAASWVLRVTGARATQLADALERNTISIEEHNDGRFVMVMAMRRLIDSGCEELAARRIAREMHDLYADNPPLPHPKYRFSFDWVSPHTAAWARDLEDMKGKPQVRALEVGCFEGQSACWFLDNILTHPTSRLVCVDPFAVPMASVLLRYFEARYDFNVAASGSAERVTKLIGQSQVVLRTLQPASFDFIYVDGSHKIGDVLQDAVLAWTLLKPGGLVNFDDYALVDDLSEGMLARAPGRAIDAFVSLLGSSASIVRRDWQMVLRKS